MRIMMGIYMHCHHYTIMSAITSSHSITTITHRHHQSFTVPTRQKMMMVMSKHGWLNDDSQASLRVLDCFFLEGLNVLFLVGIALLRLNERTLLSELEPGKIASLLKTTEFGIETLIQVR